MRGSVKEWKALPDEDLGGKALVTLVNCQKHSCYRGERSVSHDWGYGCGDCPTCDLRAEGWTRYLAGRSL